MDVALHEPWTVERFLAWEDKQEGRHEFDGTRIVAMTRGSRAHQRIVTNLIRLLEDALDLSLHEPLHEMRIKIGRKVRYPDVAVVAGQVDDQARTLHDAIVLFEVLSHDTADMDREEKRADYADVPSLRRYVLLEQAHAPATVLERTEDGWVETQADDHFVLPELGVVLPLAAIYRSIGVR